MLGVCTDVGASCSETNGAVYQFDGGKGAIDSASSTIAGLTVGTMTTDKGIRAYRRELDGKTTTLDSLLDETRALAINDAGYTVGWSVAKDKLRYAVMYEPGKTSPLTLSTPAGYGSYAVGITDEGLIVGNLEKGSAKTPVLWSMTDPAKMQLLSKNIGTAGVTVTEILEVTRFGKIVARAKYNGVSTVLVLGGK